jgi:hypothetical protein
VIQPPNTDIDAISTFADWIELSTLVESTGTVGRAEIGRIVAGLGLVGLDTADYLPGDEDFLDEDSLSTSDAVEEFLDGIWRELDARARELGDGYPFRVGTGLERVHPSWEETPAYTMMLMVDLARQYDEAKVRWIRITADSASSSLFERIVAASEQGLLGLGVRFGWIPLPDWPTGIDARIRELGNRLDLLPTLYAGATDPDDKDRGLDVSGRWRLPGGLTATYVLATQCATGRNWKRKAGEPSLAKWRNLLAWDAVLMRAVAVPWRLDGRWDLRRAYEHFDAVILDRPRICAGKPDSLLDGEARGAIADWCRKRLGNLPAYQI